jgi:hypothetical protein
LSAIALRPQRALGDDRRPGVRVVLGLAIGGLVFGALAGYLATSGGFGRVGALCAVLLPVLLWKRPYLGPAVLLTAALLAEQDTSSIIPITGNLGLFEGVGPGHLQGADILILLVAVIYLLRRDTLGPRWRPRSHVTAALGLLSAAVVFGIVVGHAHHGDLREALMEARPYVYLVATYFLTCTMVTNRKAFISVLWAFVLTVGLKALQGLYVYYETRHNTPRPETVIGHEASYFFVIYMILVCALWLFNEPGRLRTVATRMLPLILACNFVNDRRAAYEMLGGALLTVVVIAYRAAPFRRRLLGKCVVLVLLASAVYFPVFWNKSDSIAQPARAVRSQVKPSARDASSDLYRVQENENLMLNIKQGGLVGKGFGLKIDYALPITDISPIDPLIAYIPHNDVLYVEMRMGVLGGIAIWWLIGTGIIAGCRLARSRDRMVAVIGTVVASALVAYALMGAVDQGFFWYRLAFVTGTLLGLAEAARRLQQERIPIGYSR